MEAARMQLHFTSKAEFHAQQDGTWLKTRTGLSNSVDLM